MARKTNTRKKRVKKNIEAGVGSYSFYFQQHNRNTYRYSR